MRMIADMLTRLQLPINNLRAQAHDGAGNMSGKFSGCQAEMKKMQPLACYTHCGAHISHLIASKAIQSSSFVRNALDHLHELGKLYKSSGKFKHLYLNLHAEDSEIRSPKQLKPICPTQWLTRSAAIKSLLDNYTDVLEALKEASTEFGTNVSSRANGISKCLSSSKCVLGLISALPVIQCLEKFNRACRGQV